MTFPGGLLSGAGGGDVGAGLIRIGADVRGLRQQVRQGVSGVKQELDRGAAEVRGAGRLWGTAFGVLRTAAVGLGVGVVGALAAAAGASMSYETAFAGVIKTTGAAPPVLDKLRKGFRELSTQIPISANELAKLGESAGALGIPVQNIQDFVRVTALLGTTTNVSADDAATALGQLSNVLGLTGKDYERFGSTLVQLGNTGASTEAQILEIANRAGAVGHNIGLSTPAILAFSSAVANLGIEVEAGGTALQMLFTRMSLLLTDKEKLAELGKTAGMTGTQFKRAFLTDAQGAIVAFLRGLGKLDSVQKSVTLQDLGLAGARTSRAYIGLANSLERNLIPAFDSANKGWTQNIALQRAADIRFATTGSALTLLKNRVVNLLIELGDHLNPAIAKAAHWLGDMVPKAAAAIADAWNTRLYPAVRGMLDGFGRLASAVIAIFTGGDKAADWGGVVKGVFDGLVGVLAFTAKHLGEIAGFLGAVLGNPVIQNLARFLLLWTAVRLAIDGAGRAFRGLSGGGQGLRGFANWLTFGAGGKQAPAATPEAEAARAMEKAAGSHEGAAKALTAAAEKIAVAGGSAAPGAMPKGPLGPATAGAWNPTAEQRARLNYVLPAGSAMELGSKESAMWKSAYEKAWARQQLTTLAPPTLSGIRQAGRNIVSAAGNALAAGVSVVRTGGSLAARGLGAIAGVAGRLFWPAMVASFAIDLAAAPIGGFVANNLGLKHLGAEMSTDLIGGIGTWLTSVFNGVDVETIADLKVKEITVGGVTLTAVEAAKMGMSRAQIEQIFTDNLTVAGTVTSIKATQTKLTDVVLPSLEVPDPTGPQGPRALQQFADNLRATAKQYGLDFDRLVKEAVAKGLPAPTTGRFGEVIDPKTLDYIAGQVRAKAEADMDRTVGSLRDQVGAQLKKFGFKPGDVAGLTDEQVESIAETLALNTNGQYDEWFNSILRGVRGRLEGHVPTVTTPTTLTRPGQRPVRVPPEEGRGATAAQIAAKTVLPGTSAFGAGEAQLASLQKTFEDFKTRVAQDLGGAAGPAKLGQGFIDQYADAIKKGLSKATNDKQRAALAKQLGFSSWKEFIGAYNRAIEATGQDQLITIANSLSNVLTVATKNGFDASQTTANKATIKLLSDALHQGNLAPEAETAIRKVLFQAATAQLVGQLPTTFKGTGAKLMRELSAGADSPKVRADVLAALNAAVKGGAVVTHDTVVALQQAGLKIPDSLLSEIYANDQKQRFITAGIDIIRFLAAGIESPTATTRITTAVANAMSYIGKQVPRSPVAEGPLKHPFLPNAGRKIIEQIAAGMRNAGPLPLPALAAMPALPQMPGAFPRGALRTGARQAASQTINIDHLHAEGADDEFSIGARLAFMAPGGR